MRTRQAKNTQQYLSQKVKLLGEFSKFEIDIHAPEAFRAPNSLNYKWISLQ